MATRTLTVSADTAVDTTRGLNGNGSGLFVGNGSGIGLNVEYASLLKFNLDWSSVATITSARLYLRASGIWQGGSPGQTIKRLTAAFSEAGATSVPASTSSGQVSSTLGGTIGAWYSVDITAIVKAWAPASIPGGGGATNYGICMVEISTSSNDAASFYDRESAYDPYIVLTYTTNTAPYAPINRLPAGGTIVASQTPTITFTHSDPEGDALLNYDYQSATTSDFSSGFVVNVTNQTVGISGNNVARTDGASYGRGTVYYWRARTRDPSGLVGPWSVANQFKIASLPVATISSPLSAGVAELYYNAGSNLSPKLRSRWSYTGGLSYDGDGHYQGSAIIRIYNDNAGAKGTLLSTETYTGTALTYDSTQTLTADTKYWVSVQPTCSLGVQGAESTALAFRVRYGRASYYYDAGATPGGSISASSSVTIGANQALVLEYATTAGVASEPTTWYASVGAAGKNRYLWHRVTMWGWGASPATSPKLNSLTWSYEASTLVPDGWAMPTGASIDTGTFVYGTQSLKMAADGNARFTNRLVNLLPNTDYVLSGRIKTQGSPVASLRVMDLVANTVFGIVSAVEPDTDWTRYSIAFNSAGFTSLSVVCAVTGSSPGIAWFDAIKLEASAVVTPWSPGFVGQGVTVDALGLQVDASQSGVFRLQGSAGGVTDVTKLGVHGLEGRQDQPLTPTGFASYVYPAGVSVSESKTSSSLALAVVASGNAGSIVQPYVVTAPMYLQGVSIINVDTASLRTAEWGLYVDLDQSGTLTRVASGTWSFTPTVASNQTSTAASAPIKLAPGQYFLIIRNTSAAQTFGVGLTADEPIAQVRVTRVHTAHAALGATEAMSAFTSATNSRQVGAALRCRVAGESGAY